MRRTRSAGTSPGVAIGTSALAVALNAFANLAQHARAGTVKWPCAVTFAASGVVGALIGSTIGKMLNGEHLLALFALVICGRPPAEPDDIPAADARPRPAAPVTGIVSAVGAPPAGA